MRHIYLMILFSFTLNASLITPSEVYSQTMKINNEVEFLLAYYDIDKVIKKNGSFVIKTDLKPRNVWQKTYEIMIKINMLRVSYGLPIIEPVNLIPVLDLNPDLVYEQTQRMLTEINIFKLRVGIVSPNFKIKTYKNKTPLDVYNLLDHISTSFDKLNKSEFTPSYVFGESMRVYDDLSAILQYLNIKDKTIPSIRNDNATPSDTFTVAMKILYKIGEIQSAVGIKSVDFAPFRKNNPTPSDVFTMVQMIIAELQTLKAFIGLDSEITPSASLYSHKTPADVDQLMNWNLRKLNLIDDLSINKIGVNK